VSSYWRGIWAYWESFSQNFIFRSACFHVPWIWRFLNRWRNAASYERNSKAPFEKAFPWSLIVNSLINPCPNNFWQVQMSSQMKAMVVLRKGWKNSQIWKKCNSTLICQKFLRNWMFYYLWNRCTQFTDEGMNAIAKSLQTLPSLKKIDLSYDEYFLKKNRNDWFYKGLMSSLKEQWLKCFKIYWQYLLFNKSILPAMLYVRQKLNKLGFYWKYIWKFVIQNSLYKFNILCK